MKKLSQKSSAAMQTLERAIASAEKYKDPQRSLPKTYDWLMEMRQHVETSSYVAQGEYETPNGVKKVAIALPGLKSMFSHIADILDDTRNRHSITVADPLNPQGLILQILDRITGVGVDRAMKLYSVIEGKRLPVECYLAVAFRVDIVGAGKNAVAPYEKRDGNTWWSEQDLESTVVQMLHMDREDAVKFLDSQVEQKVIERVSGGFAPHAVMKGLRKMSDLRHSDVTPIAINFEEDSPLTQEQRKAINDCLSSGLSILIAPGGSGKTFSLSYAIKELISLGYSVAVVAPTGVACETVRADVRKNIEYKFIECLASKDVRTIDWCRCAPTAPKDVDVLFVDESSMMDYDHLNGLPNCKYLILIGDLMQLPPIGMGSPLSDALKFIEPVTLKANMRAKDSPELAARLDRVRMKHELVYREFGSDNDMLYSKDWKFQKMPSSSKDAQTNAALAKELYSKCLASGYMYRKLCTAYRYDATVTCLRKDIIIAVNRWFISKERGASEEELKALASEIQVRSLVNKKQSATLFGDYDIDMGFKPGDEVVWISAREDVVKNGNRESVYSGFVGNITGDDGECYSIKFPRCELSVLKSECTEKQTPIYLSRARNIHKLQSLGTDVVMYIVDRVTNKKDSNGAWQSIVDLSEAYTSVSRSRKWYIIANAYGIKIANRLSENTYSITLEEAPAVDSAVDKFLN